jgi:hypothetical protein
MAQLKVKQISDFVSAVATVHNGVLGTQTQSAIDAEVTRAGLAESANSSAIVSEAGTARAAEGVLESAISSEAGTARAAESANASAISAEATTARSAESANASAIASEAGTARAAEGVNSSAIATEKSRIDAILNASDADKDTFAEIVTLINQVDTTNDNALAAVILDINSEIADTNADVIRIDQAVIDAETAAIAEAESKDAIRATAANAYADQAEADAISTASSDATTKANAALVSAKSYADQAEVDAISTSYSYTDQAEADAISTASSDATTKANTAQSNAILSSNGYTDGREVNILSTLRGEISDLAGTDKLEQIGSFVNGTQFTVPSAISVDNNDVLVYVNGMFMHGIGSGDTDGYTLAANGSTFNVSNIGYALEASDHIVVVGVAV